jgi:Fe-S cluster assembly iron-binding protein IscA
MLDMTILNMTMLNMTEDAAHLTRTLAHRGSRPGRGGLRIILNPDTDSLSMGLAAAPEDADAVIARDGALLFVSVPAAERLQGRTLCAEITSTRSTFFLDP